MWVFLAVLACAAPAAARAGGEVPRAQELIRSGRAQEAWRLLSPMEFERAGQADFDYVLGLAALESGQAGRATLIFERVLAVDPNHAAARLDMARAYYRLGDFDRARTEFETVLRLNPPAAARATIERHLADIERRVAPARLRARGWLEGGIGHDSNVPSGPSVGSFSTALFPGTPFALSPASREASDRYAAIGGGGEFSYALAGSAELIGALDLRSRLHARLDSFDSLSSDARLGIQAGAGKDRFRLSVAHGGYDLDNRRYRRTQALAGEWIRAFDARTRLSAFVQDVRSRYLQDATRSESGNAALAGLGVQHAFEAARPLALSAGLYAGAESATETRADGDKSVAGLRLAVQYGLRADIDLLAAAALHRSRYSVTNVLFDTRRRESLGELSFGLAWRMSPNWSLRPQLTYLRNDSNIVIYDYDRYDLSLTLRRDFR
ncbi:MAG: hypothetical protein OHK0026_14260 [Rhodocyclaceae bacterium]